MKLSKFGGEDLISFELKAQTKDEAIRELADLASNSKLVKDPEQLLKDILEREKLVTTGVGYGVGAAADFSRRGNGVRAGLQRVARNM